MQIDLKVFAAAEGVKLIRVDAPSLERTGLAEFSVASNYGFGSYKSLHSQTAGTGLGYEVHHLIEKRFAPIFGVKPGDMLSIVLTKSEHHSFTQAWRTAIQYGTGTATATKADVLAAAKVVYKDHPDILQALGL